MVDLEFYLLRLQTGPLRPLKSRLKLLQFVLLDLAPFNFTHIKFSQI